jgi:pimeloyl-ACP methyl ester carboxylesterase
MPREYAQGVSEAIGNASDVIVVGHLLGGLTIPLVAAARPVRRLVFLNAFIPIPGQPFNAQFGDEGHLSGLTRGNLAHRTGRRVDSASFPFLPDCPLELAHWAAAKLRAQSLTPPSETCPLQK